MPRVAVVAVLALALFALAQATPTMRYRMRKDSDSTGHTHRFRTVAALRQRLAHGRAHHSHSRLVANADVGAGVSTTAHVGVSAFTAVTVNGRAVTITNNHVNTRTHLPPPAAAALPAPCNIAFTFTNPGATTLSWSAHGANAWIPLYMPGAMGALAAGAFVWAPNLAIGANDFDVQLAHGGAQTVLRLQIFRESYGRDLFAGLELESDLSIRLADPLVPANHLDMANRHPSITAANVPVIGVPYLQFDIDGLAVAGTHSAGILEIVTGAISVGRTTGALGVPQDWRDLMYAMAQWWASADAVLAGCNGGNSITGVDGGGGAVRRYRLLNDVVTHYNLAINAAAGARAGLANFVLNAIGAVNAVSLGAAPMTPASNHYWYARCASAYNPANTNLQVNIDYPLYRYGLIKTAGINNAAPTHFIDLFPAQTHAAAGAWYSQTRFLKRAQTEANRIVNALNLYPAHDDVLLKELKGAVAVVLNEVMVRTHHDCKYGADQHAWDAQEALDVQNGVRAVARPFVPRIGWTKNLRVNMVKACAQDLFRMFPATLTGPLMNWWNGAAAGGVGNAGVVNGVVANLMAPATPHTGGFAPAPCAAAPHPGGYQQQQARVYMAEYGRQAFGSHGVWAARYGVSETNLAIGNAGVTTNVQGTGGFPNLWTCVSGGGWASQIPPLSNKLYGRKAVVVESRFNVMELNVALLNTNTPLVSDGNPNLQTGLDIIKTAAGAPDVLP